MTEFAPEGTEPIAAAVSAMIERGVDPDVVIDGLVYAALALALTLDRMDRLKCSVAHLMEEGREIVARDIAFENAIPEGSA